MPYLKKIIKFKNSIEIEKCFSGKYGWKGKPQKKRIPSSEEIKKMNRRQAVKKLRWKIKANFNEIDDFHLVLTYKKEKRPDADEAKRRLKNFLQNVRRQYKKRGHDLKYIIVTEYKNKAIHHHLVINGIPDTIKLICQYWPHGRPNFTPLHEEESLGELAEYLIKETDKTFREKEFQKQRYSCSRNLVEPDIKIEIVMANTFRKEIKPCAGYYIDKSSVVEGINEFGYRYQFYSMVKIKKLE